MLIVGAFQHTLELEHALISLDGLGLGPHSVLAVPMEAGDSFHSGALLEKRDRKAGAFETGMAFATGFAVIGISRGFLLAWGPIIWGIIAGSSGFCLGLLAFTAFARIREGRKPVRGGKPLPEVTVIVRCPEDRKEQIARLLWEHQALTVGIFSTPAMPPLSSYDAMPQHPREA